MERLAKGTKENLYVYVADRLNTLTTLDSVPLTWEVLNESRSFSDGGPASNVDMVIVCGPVDTTAMAADEYDLFVNVSLPPEDIRLGPYHFIVN